ncbi:MAG: hypothetical protein JJU29_13100 [Verrucomicrobia bacterium]|nr:hypothetical protein [Verrucomicrobiota bacterium]
MNQQATYFRFLEAAGHSVIEMEGVYWFKYNGFLRPAYLPHASPSISTTQAQKALKASKAPFIRWESGFGSKNQGDWWHVTKSGSYSISDCSSNTRSKIRRGDKRLQSRLLTPEEVRKFGYRVCEQTVKRYGSKHFLPNPAEFDLKIHAAESYPEAFEYYGVFSGHDLVGFSENHKQGNAVFWESIWYDPDHLGDYSSYLLTHSMLDYYLNAEKVQYVSDGSRSLFHETNVQTFFIEKFHFSKTYADLHILYHPLFKCGLTAAKFFMPFANKLKPIKEMTFMKKIEGLLIQDQISSSVL